MVLYGSSLSVYPSMLQVVYGFTVPVDFSAFVKTANTLLYLDSSCSLILIDCRVRHHVVVIWLSCK